QNPELSFEEHETARFVTKILSEIPDIEITHPAGTSVVGVLRGARGGRMLAIRADMDALPITEENEEPFRSTRKGVMHACGHDGHTAMLLATARVFAEIRAEWPGEIRFLFQHAEELFPGGGEEMVKAGVMDGVDAVIGTHLWSHLPSGQIAVTYGPMMAAPDVFHIRIKGLGGHAARPQSSVDSIVLASEIVQHFQLLVSRETDPLDSLVVSVTQFHAGTAHNVLPGEAELTGTVRTFNAALRNRIPERMEAILAGLCSAHRAQYELRYEKGYRPVVNHDQVNHVVEAAARSLYGPDAIDFNQRNMGGEDFSAFQEKAPGAFFYVGAGRPGSQRVYPHHHPRFTIDEGALVHGVEIFLTSGLHLLEEGF
ncbi:N-acyl-L-amino acid amidohydrolase (L-aminoacylase), partial [mine drainage metagenome]